ncbi:MAG: cobalamin-dependent protein [Prevotella sp.]|nr:cobalamin-dependent protein [Prevotella sp.]
MWNMIDGHLVNIVGGCCGTTSEHIRKIAELVNPADGCFVSGHVPGGESTAPIRKAPKPHAEKPAEPVKEAKSVATGAITTGLKDAIIAGKEAVAIEETKKAIEAGANPAELINTQMIEAMSVVGQRFSEGKAFVPNLLMAGRAMKAALAILKPIMEASGEGVQSAGKIVIGTVKGDLHDIGKNLVASMLEGSGFEVINVGIDVDAETFVKAVIDNETDILCLSALLTTTMTYMTDCLAALEAAGVRGKVKVMVGGAPVTEDFAREIGADGYSANANEAVALAKRLMAS